MSKQFVWQEVKAEYREVRASSHGEELRWLVNREKILNTATGRAVTRAVIRHLGICVMVPFLAEDQITGVELEAMIKHGEIRDAKTLIGRFFALSRRSNGVRIA